MRCNAPSPQYGVMGNVVESGLESVASTCLVGLILRVSMGVELSVL